MSLGRFPCANFHLSCLLKTQKWLVEAGAPLDQMWILVAHACESLADCGEYNQLAAPRKIIYTLQLNCIN